MNWLSMVDAIIPWDRARSRIAPSVLLLMLVINVLSQGGTPLLSTQLTSHSPAASHPITRVLELWASHAPRDQILTALIHAVAYTLPKTLIILAWRGEKGFDSS